MLLSPAEIRDAIMMALSSVRTNVLRSLLTILGVMVGVAAVITMAAVIDGLDLAVGQEIDNMGTNVILVTKHEVGPGSGRATEDERNRPPITEGDPALRIGGLLDLVHEHEVINHERNAEEAAPGSLDQQGGAGRQAQAVAQHAHGEGPPPDVLGDDIERSSVSGQPLEARGVGKAADPG